MSGVIEDVRYASRQLRKTPGFAIVSVLMLALGIGANTAIFSILDPLLLRKLPVPHPDEPVYMTSAGGLGAAETFSSAIQSFYTYRDHAQVFSGVVAFTPIVQYEIGRDDQKSQAGNLHSSQAREIMELFRELNQQGTTIAQVTHSAVNAAYGSRTILLCDGWVVGDTANPDLQSYEAVKR